MEQKEIETAKGRMYQFAGIACNSTAVTLHVSDFVKLSKIVSNAHTLLGWAESFPDNTPIDATIKELRRLMGNMFEVDQSPNRRVVND